VELEKSLSVDGENLPEDVPKRPKTIDKSIGTGKVTPLESSPHLDQDPNEEFEGKSVTQSQQMLPRLPSHKSLTHADVSQKNSVKTGGNAPKSMKGLQLPPIAKPVRAPPPPKPYTLHDFVFPGGIIARMAKLEKMIDCPEPAIMVILEKFKFDKPRPVIVCSGSRKAERGKFLAGKEFLL
jgi:hypothetical protein